MDDKVWKLRNFSLALQIIYKNSVNSSLSLNIQWNRQFHEIIAKNAWERISVISTMQCHSVEITEIL